MSHFDKYIYKYRSIVNYDIEHSETAYKYLFKALYGRTNKKEYVLQILQHNKCHTSTLTINDIVIDVKEGQKKPK